MKNIHKLYVPLLFSAICALVACEKEEDPFVDRTVAPVLVVIENAKASYLTGGGLSTEPVVEAKLSEPVQLVASVYELDKSGILNNAVGIDSIPVANLSLSLSTRAGVKIADATTDASGKILFATTWAALGLEAPKRGNTVSLDWAGSYNGVGFVRRSQVQVVE